MTDRYTFGDGPTARHRLDLLAEVYRPATEAFLRERAPRQPELAVDLGCGPGHTTRLLHEISQATRTTGLDASTRYLELAAADPPAGVDFARADLSRGPLPVPPADLMLCRFLLTHLSAPQTALRSWVAALRPGGVLLAQETARLASPAWQFQRYYELVGAVQRSHGQALEIGARLAGLAAGTGAQVCHVGRRRLVMPAPVMARLHVLNLRTWRDHPVVHALAEPEEVDVLDSWLEAVAVGRVTTPPVDQELTELVLRRGC
ncbi:MAG TPA: class I SAM-dependent methyltransferase [Kineosporiaceae bacterium]|nr:class I SAM-dependent methyltransferase [Kineosporiaceae bacterium]